MNSRNFRTVGLILIIVSVFFASTPAIGGEAELISVLKSDADWGQKQDACRQLKQIGTKKSIGALAGLLNDAELAHWARYALESMPYSEVDEAFRKALGNTSATERIA